MAALATNTAVRAGLVLTDLLAAAGGSGDTFTNTGAELFYVSNASGTTRTVTFVTTATVDGLAVADRAVTVANAKLACFGPFKRNDYGSTVSVTYDSSTSVTVAVVKVTPEVV